MHYLEIRSINAWKIQKTSDLDNFDQKATWPFPLKNLRQCLIWLKMQWNLGVSDEFIPLITLTSSSVDELTSLAACFKVHFELACPLLYMHLYRQQF